MNPSEQRVSVCICTYNRCAYLGEMLATLAAQRLLDGDEVLVINNNSNDETQSVVKSFSRSLPIKHIFEPVQGLSHARNRALKEATNDLILFFDDDVLLGIKVIDSYRRASARYPNAGFMGGRIVIAWPLEQPPNWWRSEDYGLLNGLLINYNLGDQDRQYKPDDRLPYGANFALRQSTVAAVGEFDVRLGVSGDSIGRGEESDYFARAIQAGITGVYIGDATIKHRYEPERLKLRYLLNYGIAKGQAEPPQLRLLTIYKSCSQALKGIVQLARGRRANFYQCMIMVGVYLGQAAL